MLEVMEFFFIRRIYCVALFIHLFFSLQAFFTSGAMMNVLETFCIYHITAPGQEAGAEDLPEGYVYPTMDELADQVDFNHEVLFLENFTKQRIWIEQASFELEFETKN